VDQERYFEEFPHAQLSVCNFSYVRRPLGLNNQAYELIREAKSGLETRATRASDKMRESKRSYREVPEHEGLLSSSGEEDGEGEDGEEGDDEVKEITDFDIGLPLTLQVAVLLVLASSSSLSSSLSSPSSSSPSSSSSPPSPRWPPE
jgi:hypothetical protein